MTHEFMRLVAPLRFTLSSCLGPWDHALSWKNLFTYLWQCSIGCVYSVRLVCHIFVITGYKHTQIMQPFIVRRRHFRRIPHIPGLQDALQDLSQGPGLRTQDSWRLLWAEMLLSEDALQPRLWSKVEKIMHIGAVSLTGVNDVWIL